MRQNLIVLAGGYGFILLTCFAAWLVAAGFSRVLPTQRIEGLPRSDLRIVAWILAAWTIARLAGIALMTAVGACAA